MREKRPLIIDKEPMRDSDKVSASPGPYLMLLSDCTAPTISQSLHPLSTSLKHSHQHHHRHTHTHSDILNTVPAYWLLWHAPIVEQMVHLISCKIGTVLCYLMGKGHKMTIFSPFRKTEQKKKNKCEKGELLHLPLCLLVVLSNISMASSTWKT